MKTRIYSCKQQRKQQMDKEETSWKNRLNILMNHLMPNVQHTKNIVASAVATTNPTGTVIPSPTTTTTTTTTTSTTTTTTKLNTQHPRSVIKEKMRAMSTLSTMKRARGGSDVLVQFSPLVTGRIQRSLVTYLTPHTATAESLQAGILLVASTRADIRRQFINRLCDAAVERSALVYSIAPSGSANVQSEGVYKLTTHPTLSRRAILNALLRHGAHLLVFGTISTRDDVMALMDAAYTGYHCVAEIYGESAHDVLSRLEAIGVDVSTLPQNLRIVVPRISN
jgi:hypothetical protein